MLQIASGKLFKRPAGQRNELRGIAYTNLQMYGRKPIETVAGRIVATDSLRGDKGIIYELTELIEDPPDVGVIASHGIDPYINDFTAVVSFALGVTCTPDADIANRLTSDRRGPGFSVPPRKLIRRVFDDQIPCKEEDAVQLIRFVDDLIGLRRKVYLGAMRAIRTYVTGLHRLADDLELAYTLFVISIESLALNFDGKRAKWEDYEESKRHAIDQALTNAGCKTAKQIRNTLLEFEHVSLKRRFRDFALAQLKPSFFRDDAAALEYPVARAELHRALNQAYDLRSRYLHNLAELPKQLKLGNSYNETERVGRVVLLTFQGIARLARHVIGEYIKRQPKVKSEDYDYSLERAGIVQVPLTPKYWVWRADNLTASSGCKRLEGLLDEVALYLQNPSEARITDLRDMLSKIEGTLPQISIEQRRSFLAIYSSSTLFCQVKNGWANLMKFKNASELRSRARPSSQCWFTLY